MQEGPGKGGQNSEESLEDEEAQRCPICLNRPRRTDRAIPDCCRHVYCLTCILRWAQMVQSCPVDRRPFSVIYLQGSSQQCIKLPVKTKPRLKELHSGCSQDGQHKCRVSVAETGSTERTQETRANPKQKCHRNSGDSDAFVDINKKASGDSCHSLPLTQHFNSSLPSQQGAVVGTLAQIMEGSVEVCEDGVQWRRLDRKRRLLQATVPVLSTCVPRVSVRSHLLLSAVSASLNLLLSEHTTVPHGIVCAVTCPKGEERKGTRGSGSKTSVKPAEAAATRRSSRHSRGEVDSQPADSPTTSSSSPSVNDTASTSRGQQGNNPRSGVKTRGRPKKQKVEKREDEEQENEVENHKKDSEETKNEQRASSDEQVGDQDLLNKEEKMEVENETSAGENSLVSPDADNQDEETEPAPVEEVVTKNVVEEEGDQKISQEDSNQEVEMDNEDQVELVNISPQDCPSPSRSPSSVELQDSDSQDAHSPFQVDPPTDASNPILDLESDETDDDSDKQESSSLPLLQLNKDPEPKPEEPVGENTPTQDYSSLSPLQGSENPKLESDTKEEKPHTPDCSSFSTLHENEDLKLESDTPEENPHTSDCSSLPPLQENEDSRLESDPTEENPLMQDCSSLPPFQENEDPKLDSDTTEENSPTRDSSSPPPLQDNEDPTLKSDTTEDLSVPAEIAAPEIEDANASNPQDNTDPIPMECDSPVSESEVLVTEAESVANATVAPMANQGSTDKVDGCKDPKGSDKREREGRSRRSRFHSPTTTWSPSRESRNEGSRRSRSRSRDRSHKARSTSRSREREGERDSRRNRSRSRSRERSRRRRSRSRNRNRSGRRSPSQERTDHGGHSPRNRSSWSGDGWRGRGGGRGFRNSSWRNNAEKPGHFSTRDPVSDNGNFHESSPDQVKSENPDWVRERERPWQDSDTRGREPRRDENLSDPPGESWSRGSWNAGREPRRDENLSDPPGESWSRGSWNAGRGRGGAHWSSSQQGESGDNWRQRNSFSGTANNTDSYSRFNENRAGGKRKDSEGGDTPLDRSGWSSASSWAVRRTLPADVQNYYSRRDRGGGNNSWNKQEEDQTPASVPKQADPPQNEPNAPLPTEAVPTPPPALMPHQMGVMGVLRFPMGPPPLLQRPPAVGLQPPPQFNLPPTVPVQLHTTGPLIQVPSIGVQGLPPPPPPPPPLQQGGFTSVSAESHPPQQVMASFPAPGKMSFKPVPTKVVSGPGAVSAAQPSSTTQPPAHSKVHADSSKKEKKLQIQERAVNEVKAAIKPYYQKNEINKEEYKEIVRKAVEKVCHSKSGEVNADKVANLVKAYVDKYKHVRKNKSEKS